jgi:hypothetical protein
MEQTQDLVCHAMRVMGRSERELLLMLAQEHPTYFTNPEEVAAEWRTRIHKNECIPYLDQKCYRIIG